MAVILAGGVLTRIAMEVAPVGIQNLFEWLFETVEEMSKGILGEAARRFMPLFLMLFLFILTSNLLGLIPGFISPTSSYHTNLAMALAVSIVYNYAGIRAHGLRGYLKHFLPPPCHWLLMWTLMWWMWPLIEGLSLIIRPLSLTMRLFGNIFAKEVLLLLLPFVTLTFWASDVGFVKCLSVVPFALRTFIVLLGTLVSLVQAVVFTMLAMVFIGLAIGGHEEEHHVHETAG